MQQEFLPSGSYNILSLDGGGTWAVLQAMALADIYGGDTPGRQILRHFNLVTANSGGSLVAASLWADMTPNDLIGEFDRDAILQNVFSRLSWLKAFPRSIFTSFKLGPKYSSERKLKAIAGVIDRYRPGLADTPIQALERNSDAPAAGRRTCCCSPMTTTPTAPNSSGPIRTARPAGRSSRPRPPRRSGRPGSPPTRSNTARPLPKRSMPRPTRPSTISIPRTHQLQGRGDPRLGRRHRRL